MKTFEEKKFNIPKLKGISDKTVEEHLKLYAGYVKNANEILSSGQFERRFPFEFNGMRNHELYFSHFEGGPQPVNPGSPLALAGHEEWPSYEAWLNRFKAIAVTRGIGWAVLLYDKKNKRLLTSWIDEQHLGQLNGCEMILALDMWEHAFVYDYSTSEKKKYIDAFFDNLNWEVIEENFKKVQ